MKKILLIAFAALTIISCKKDDPTGGGSAVWPDYIPGNWSLDDVEMQVKLNFQGLPIAVDGESVATAGGYTFNSDNTFEYDWSAEVEFDVPGLFSDTIPIAQQGAGTYTVIGEDVIELDEAGVVSTLDIVSKSPTLIIVQLEDKMMLDSLGEVDVEVQSILSK